MEDINHSGPIPAPEPTRDQRDAGALITAISQAILSVTSGEHKPSPEAMASALVSMQAQFLASIPDPRIRKNFRKGMESLLPQLMAQMIAADLKRGL
jgi:hypothetical protein